MSGDPSGSPGVVLSELVNESAEVGWGDEYTDDPEIESSGMSSDVLGIP